MRARLLIVLCLSIFSSNLAPAEEGDAKARQLAQEVWRASGGESWPKVKAIRFTFIVEENGKELARAAHDWNVAAGTDRVQWKGKDVTVNLLNPAETEDAKSAHARWVNDSYWLLAPLKVLDAGVKLSAEGPQEVDGVRSETLRLSFTGVGLTPGDQYLLYLDPETKLIRAWDYMPSAEKKMHGTWEKYEKYGGLTLATSHDFAGKIIRFADIKVEASE